MVFSVLGFVLFAGIDDNDCKPFRAKAADFCSTFRNDCSDYFNSLEGSLVQLFELLTAANFPKLAEPAYRCSAASSLYFAVFTVVGVYLLLSLTLAVAANTFQSLMADEVVAKYGRMFTGYDMAWAQLATLAPPHPDAAAAGAKPRLLLQRDDFVRFLSMLRPYVDSDASGRLFAVFDPHGAGGLDQKAFRKFLLHFGPVNIRRRRRRRPQSVALRASSGPARHRVSALFIGQQHLSLGATGSSAHATAGDASGESASNRNSLAVSEVSVGIPEGDRLSLRSSATGGNDVTGIDQFDDFELDDLDGEAVDDGDEELEALDMDSIAIPLPLGAAALSPYGLANVLPGDARVPLATPGTPLPAVVSNPLAAAAAGGSTGLPPPPPPLAGTPAADRAARANFLASPPAGASATLLASHSGSDAGGSSTSGPGSVASWGPAAARRRRGPAQLARDAADGLVQALSVATTRDGYPGDARLPLPRGVAPASLRGRAIRFLRKTGVMLFFDAAILVNTAAVLVQVSTENDEEDSTADPTVRAMQAVEWAMLAVFLAEVVAKLAAWGPAAYWRESRFNRLDAALLVVAVVGAGLDNANAVSDQVSSATSFVRFLRLVRVLRVMPGFGLTVGAFGDIVPVLLQYGLCVACSFYFFALVGMQAFGGKFLASNPAVAASSYGQVNYYLFNFDSLPEAGMSLLFLVVLNDWPILMDAAVAATGKGAILYFAAFWLCNVVVIMNVVIAFLIESFNAQKTKRERLAALEALKAARTASLRAPKTSSGSAAAGGEGPSGGEPANRSSGVVVAGTVQPGDWRDIVLRSGVDFSGYHLSRGARSYDVYEDLYLEQLQRAYPDTFHNNNSAR